MPPWPALLKLWTAICVLCAISATLLMAAVVSRTNDKGAHHAVHSTGETDRVVGDLSNSSGRLFTRALSRQIMGTGSGGCEDGLVIAFGTGAHTRSMRPFHVLPLSSQELKSLVVGGRDFLQKLLEADIDTMDKLVTESFRE